MDTEDINAFNQGFSEDAIIEQKTEPAPVPPPEPEVTPEPEAPSYRNLSQEEYDTLLSKSSSVDDMQKNMDKVFGKLGVLQRTLTALQSAPTAVEMSPDDFAGLGEYGDELPKIIAEGLNKKLANLKNNGNNTNVYDFDERLSAAKLEAIEAAKAEVLTLQKANEQAAVEEEHPDFKEVIADEKFIEWVGSLPENRRTKLENSWSAAVVGRAVAEFKALKTPSAPKKDNSRAELLAASAVPKGISATVKQSDSALDAFNEGFRTG